MIVKRESVVNKQFPSRLCAVSTGKQSGDIARFVEQGVKLFLLRNTLKLMEHTTEECVEIINNLITPLQGIGKELEFVIEINMDPTSEWLSQHPQERCDPCPVDAPCVSWGSELWKRDASIALRSLTKALAKMPVRAVMLSTGASGIWGDAADPRMVDTGRSMTYRLQNDLRIRYRKNVLLLRKEWNDPHRDFHTVRPPSIQDRRLGRGVLREPTRTRSIYDWLETLHSALNSALLSFCKVVHETSHNGIAVAACCSSLFAVCEAGGMPAPLLEEDGPDVFIAPDGNRLCDGTLRLNGKVGYKFEQRTSPSFEIFSISEAVVKKPAKGTKQIPGIALITDPSASFWLSERDGLKPLWTALRLQLDELEHSGLPYEIFSLGDLFHKQFPDTLLSVFLNTWYVSEAERRQIDARIKRSGKMALWLWGVGVLGESGAMESHMLRMTGIKCRVQDLPGTLKVRPNPQAPLTMSLQGRIGTDIMLSPTFQWADHDAALLAVNSAGKPAMELHRFAEWTSVVCSAVPVPSELLKNLMSEAEYPQIPPVEKTAPAGRQLQRKKVIRK